MPQAGVDHIRHPTDGNVENRLGHRIKKFRAVDVRKVADAIHPSNSRGHGHRVANIALEEFHVGLDIRQPRCPSPGFVVETAYTVPRLHERPYQSTPDETRAASYENVIHGLKFGFTAIDQYVFRILTTIVKKWRFDFVGGENLCRVFGGASDGDRDAGKGVLRRLSATVTPAPPTRWRISIIPKPDAEVASGHAPTWSPCGSFS